MGLTVVYMQAGQEERAREQARRVLALNADFRVSTHPVLPHCRDENIRAELESFLLPAGLPR